ncbi:MAG: phosphodiester glycosidase family protein [Prevotellaceae bacterium]|jgi:uncharacterized protein YigE (DUF2233 family)|nr:phosphodiester glycosidase family protein [Prevotellaceae bacterium]
MKNYICIILFAISCAFSACISAQSIQQKNNEILLLKSRIEGLEIDSILQFGMIKHKDSIINHQDSIVKHYQDSLVDSKRQIMERDKLLQNNTSKKEITALKNKNATLEKEITALKDKNATLEKEIATLEKEIIALKKKLEPTISSIKSERISYKGCFFDVCIVDTKEKQITFFWKDEKNQRFQSFEKLNQYKRLLFATNAGIFTPEYTPQGLFVENGKEKNPIDLKLGNGNFYLQFGKEDKSNGIFIISKNNEVQIIKTKEYEKYKNNTQFATQSGPLLLYNGQINSTFTDGSTNKTIRSGVGYINSHKVVFAISNVPVNFFDFANMFKEKYQCSEALYLDGAISKMYLPGLNRTDYGGNFSGIIGITE